MRSSWSQSDCRAVPLQLQRVWLLCYNAYMLLCFLEMLVRLVYVEPWTLDSSSKMSRPPKAFLSTGTRMTSTHVLMYLEVLHPLFGYTRDSMYDAVLLLSIRSFLLILLNNEAKLQSMPVVYYLFVMYCLLESVRFVHKVSKHVLAPSNLLVEMLKWVRYTLWMPLEPIVFICEGVLMVAAIPIYEKSSKLTLIMPNKANWDFNMATAIKLVLLLLLFPVLYTKMSRLYKKRCVKLGVVRTNRYGTARFALF